MVGDPITITISPEAGYVHFVSKPVAGAANTKPSLDASDAVTQLDGSIEVTLTGSIPSGEETQTGA